LPWPCSTSAACAHPYPAARSPDHAHGSSTRAPYESRARLDRFYACAPGGDPGLITLAVTVETWCREIPGFSVLQLRITKRPHRGYNRTTKTAKSVA